MRRLTWSSCVAFTLALACFACGQPQRLHSTEIQPSIKRVVTIKDGYELWFDAPANRAIIIWSRHKDSITRHHGTTNSPVHLNLPHDDVDIRYAYHVKDKIGRISKWTSLSRADMPPHPRAYCLIKKNRRLIAWQPTSVSTPYGGWSIAEDNGKRWGPFPSKQRAIEVDSRATHLRVQWISDRVKSEVKRIKCQRKAPEKS